MYQKLVMMMHKK